jgi:hypothetical protein
MTSVSSTLDSTRIITMIDKELTEAGVTIPYRYGFLIILACAYHWHPERFPQVGTDELLYHAAIC